MVFSVVKTMASRVDRSAAWMLSCEATSSILLMTGIISSANKAVLECDERTSPYGKLPSADECTGCAITNVAVRSGN